MEQIQVIVYGCGVMGRRAAEALLEKESIKIAGAVDIAQDIVGKDLGELFEKPVSLGVSIEKDAGALFRETNAQAVILATTSHLKSVKPQIEQCANAGLNVISTCEELSYPWSQNADLAREIDTLAKEHGVTVVGTGINPGFLMDTLPLMLTAPCLRVDSIKVTRMTDSSKRRIPFQQKVGTTLTGEKFREKIDNGLITGHVGLLESIYFIAAGLQWTLDEAVELAPEPVITQKEVETAVGTVKPGNVVGLRSIAYAKRNGQKDITLEFNAYATVEEEYDEIVIKGVPNIRERIIGGVHGDVGTVAMTINTIPKAVQAPPGLLTMMDLPPIPAAP